MVVREVRTRTDMRPFVQLPRELHRGDPCWVSPLWVDERDAYTAKKNAILRHSDYRLLLAESGGRPVGRSLVYVDHSLNGRYGSRTGFFGAFECVNDLDAARALDDAAVWWLAQRNMDSVRGLKANCILEDNLKIRNALEKLGLDLVKSYRVYEKAI